MQDRATPTGHWPRPWMVAAGARRDTRRMFGANWLLFLIVFVALGVVDFGYDAAHKAVLESDLFPRHAGFEAASVVLLFIQALILAPLAIAVHRRLLDSARPTRARALPYALWLLAIVILPCEATAYPDTPEWLRYALVATVAILLLRLCLVFPAIASDEDANPAERFASGWARTRGHTVFLLVAMIVALVPFFVFVLLPYMVATLLLSQIFTEFLATGYLWFRTFMEPLTDVVVITLFASVTSHAFKLAQAEPEIEAAAVTADQPA